MYRVAFFGIHDRKFRALLEVHGIACDEPTTHETFGSGRVVVERFDCTLTNDDIDWIMDNVWYETSDCGETATGRPYRWNDCVTFKKLGETK